MSYTIQEESGHPSLTCHSGQMGLRMVYLLDTDTKEKLWEMTLSEFLRRLGITAQDVPRRNYVSWKREEGKGRKANDR